MGLIRDYDTTRTALVKKQVKEEEPDMLESFKQYISETPLKQAQAEFKEIQEQFNGGEIQPQEQTAEGIESFMSKYLPACDCGEIYLSRGMTAPDCVKCNYLETVADGVQQYLAQYKTKLIAAIDAREALLRRNDSLHESNKAARLKEVKILKSTIKNI